MKFKKISICFFATFFLLSGIRVSHTDYAFASSTTPSTNIFSTANIRVSKTEWRYRTVHNKQQKRLWSKSEGKWLTDWEWV